MEGALFSVIAGLVAAPVIALPTSTGYGISAGGSEKSVLHVIDLQTGNDLAEVIDRTSDCVVSWRKDNQSFFYLRYPRVGPDTAPAKSKYDALTFFHRLGQHPDGERQVSAQPNDLGYCRVAWVKPRPGGQPGQQPGRLIRRENIQADRLDVFQRGQVAAAGHQHEAPRAARQQRPHLLAAHGIVEQQQQLLTRHVITPERHPGFQARRDLRGGNPGAA